MTDPIAALAGKIEDAIWAARGMAHPDFGRDWQHIIERELAPLRRVVEVADKARSLISLHLATEDRNLTGGLHSPTAAALEEIEVHLADALAELEKECDD